MSENLERATPEQVQDLVANLVERVDTASGAWSGWCGRHRRGRSS
jgi:hypothetical protein